MRSKAGLSFVDVLIIIAIVLLLAALAIPRFIKAPDYGDEADETQPAADTNAAPAKLTNAPAVALPAAGVTNSAESSTNAP